MPAAISPRITSSDSPLGSSAVSIVRSARPAATCGTWWKECPLLNTPQARRTESRDHATAGEFTGRLERLGQRVGCVGEVDDDAERLSEVDSLHPSRDAGEPGEALSGAFRRDPQP